MKPGNSGKKDFIKVPYSGSRWLTQLKSQLLKWLNTKLVPWNLLCWSQNVHVMYKMCVISQNSRHDLRHTFLKHRYNLKTLSLKQEFKMYTSKAYLI